MGCYWEINGEVVAKKGSVEKVLDVLNFYEIDIDEKDDEKISFSFYEYNAYATPDDLDHDLRPLVEDGEFTVRTDGDEENEENIITYRYRYGQKGPSYEKSVTFEYFPSEVDEFVKTLPKELIHAVVKEYIH